MPEAATTFRKLLHPVEPLDFVETRYGREALHVPGRPAKARPVCSWDAFADLMGMTAVWTGETLKLVLDGETLPPEAYCEPAPGRDNQRVMRPDYARVQQRLEQGATIVADLIETLSPGIRDAATALEMGLGARVTCNAYLSQQSRQAFHSHFDTMDVFVLQIEGTKRWRVYEGRFEHPLERPGLSYPYFSQAHHDRARKDVELDIELSPGDLLYVPAGVYHDAVATSDACLHLSFGVTRPTALDYFRWVLESLDEFPELRAPLPDYADAPSSLAALHSASRRLADLMASEAPRRQFLDEQRRRAHGLFSPLRIPPGAASDPFRVTPAELKKSGAETVLRTARGETPVGGDTAALARWLMERDFTDLAAIGQRLRKSPPDAIERAVAALMDAGLLVRL